MKKFSVVLAFLLLVGCGGAKVDVDMMTAPTPEEKTDVVFIITHDGEAVTDFEGTAEFKMVDMDHGSETTDLAHEGDSEYKGQVNLPMAGQWSVDIMGESEAFGKIDKTIEVSVE